MPTIRESLLKEMNSARRLYNYRRRQLRLAEKVLLDGLMDTDIPYKFYIGTWGGLHISFRVKDSKVGRELAATFMDALGVGHAEKKRLLNDAYTIIIEKDGLRVDVDVDARPCKKYLVTERHTLEVCGEIDRSRYLEVVPVAD